MVNKVNIELKLAAGRMLACQKFPYLAKSIRAMIPVPSTGVATMGVSKTWVLYYNPETISSWSATEVAAVLMHEVTHLLRKHWARFAGRNHMLANIATDMEINDDLQHEIKPWRFPLNPVLPASAGFPDHLLAEQYYDMLFQQANQFGQFGQSSDQPNQNLPSSSGSSGGSGKSDPDESDGSEKSDGSGSGQSEQPDNQDQSSGSGSGKSDQSEQSDQSDGSGSGKSDESDNQEQSDGSGDSRQSNQSENQNRGGFGHGNCGSGATGHVESWETENDKGLTEIEADILAREVAKDIREHAKRSRSSIPAHWQRWADELLEPQVDWRKELAQVLHRTVVRAGQDLHTMARPSRRQSAYKPFIMPGKRSIRPEIAVIVDTSGSIGDAELSQAVSEVVAIVRANGYNEITVMSVDADVHTVKKVRRKEDIQLAGGGGTDMGIGLKAASKLKPKPDIVIVLTDGITPWPEKKPPFETIVALVAKSAYPTPGWAKVVEVKK